jgi:hypothetical protein
MRHWIDHRLWILRLKLAKALYWAACRLAGREMAAPESPDAIGAWAMLTAQRYERIAREWRAKYGNYIHEYS